MNKMYYAIIEYIRQLNFYFMTKYDCDCELYVNIYTTWYSYDFKVISTTNDNTEPYKFMYSMDDEIYNDDDNEITLDTVLVNIYLFAVNHTINKISNTDIENDIDNDIPRTIFERAKRYLSNITF